MAKVAENPDTILVPISGYIRMPAPSKEEREAMIAELEAASEDIKRGNFTVFEKEAFIEWMMDGIHKRRASK